MSGKSIRTIVLMLVTALICLGEGPCHKGDRSAYIEPSTYCKQYSTVESQKQCTEFCSNHQTVKEEKRSADVQKLLLTSCRYGQAIFLYNSQATNTYLAVECSKFATELADKVGEQIEGVGSDGGFSIRVRDYAEKGCSIGFLGEAERYPQKSLGTADDRETGN